MLAKFFGKRNNDNDKTSDRKSSSTGIMSGNHAIYSQIESENRDFAARQKALEEKEEQEFYNQHHETSALLPAQDVENENDEFSEKNESWSPRKKSFSELYVSSFLKPFRFVIIAVWLGAIIAGSFFAVPFLNATTLEFTPPPGTPARTALDSKKEQFPNFTTSDMAVLVYFDDQKFDFDSNSKNSDVVHQEEIEDETTTEKTLATVMKMNQQQKGTTSGSIPLPYNISQISQIPSVSAFVNELNIQLFEAAKDFPMQYDMNPDEKTLIVDVGNFYLLELANATSLSNALLSKTARNALVVPLLLFCEFTTLTCRNYATRVEEITRSLLASHLMNETLNLDYNYTNVIPVATSMASTSNNNNNNIDSKYSFRKNYSLSEKQISHLTSALAYGTTGMPMLLTSFVNQIKKELERMDMITLPVALVVMALTVKSLRLLILPLLSIALTVVITFSSMYGVATFLLPVSSACPPLMLTLIISSAIDYNLFLLTRFAEEVANDADDEVSEELVFFLLNGEEEEEGKERTDDDDDNLKLTPSGEKRLKRLFQIEKILISVMRSAGHTVLISGLTLAASFLSLCFFPTNIFKSFGIGCAATIFIALLVCLNLTPTLLLIFPDFFREGAKPKLITVTPETRDNTCYPGIFVRNSVLRWIISCCGVVYLCVDDDEDGTNNDLAKSPSSQTYASIVIGGVNSIQRKRVLGIDNNNTSPKNTRLHQPARISNVDQQQKRDDDDENNDVLPSSTQRESFGNHHHSAVAISSSSAINNTNNENDNNNPASAVTSSIYDLDPELTALEIAQMKEKQKQLQDDLRKKRQEEQQKLQDADFFLGRDQDRKNNNRARSSSSKGGDVPPPFPGEEENNNNKKSGNQPQQQQYEIAPGYRTYTGNSSFAGIMNNKNKNDTKQGNDVTSSPSSFSSSSSASSSSEDDGNPLFATKRKNNSNKNHHHHHNLKNPVAAENTRMSLDYNSADVYNCYHSEQGSSSDDDDDDDNVQQKTNQKQQQKQKNTKTLRQNLEDDDKRKQNNEVATTPATTTTKTYGTIADSYSFGFEAAALAEEEENKKKAQQHQKQQEEKNKRKTTPKNTSFSNHQQQQQQRRSFNPRGSEFISPLGLHANAINELGAAGEYDFDGRNDNNNNNDEIKKQVDEADAEEGEEEENVVLSLTELAYRSSMFRHVEKIMNRPWNIILLLLFAGLLGFCLSQVSRMKIEDATSAFLVTGTDSANGYYALQKYLGAGAMMPYRLLFVASSSSSNEENINNEAAIYSREAVQFAHDVILNISAKLNTPLFLFRGLYIIDGNLIQHEDFQLCLDFLANITKGKEEDDTNINNADEKNENEMRRCNPNVLAMMLDAQIVNDDKTAAMVLMTCPVDPTGPRGTSYYDTLLNTISTIAEEKKQQQPSKQTTIFSCFVLGLPADTVDAMKVVFGHFHLIAFASAAVVLVIVGISFKSIVVPLRCIFSVALTEAFVFCLLVLLYQDDDLESLHWSYLEGKNAVLWVSPIIGYFFVLGIATDFDMFMFTRIQEIVEDEKKRTKDATVRGLCSTITIINSCGLIMTIAFCGLLLSDIQVLNQTGFMLVAAVLFDSFIVRIIFVPSCVSIFGRYSFWPNDVEAVIDREEEKRLMEAQERRGYDKNTGEKLMEYQVTPGSGLF